MMIGLLTQAVEHALFDLLSTANRERMKVAKPDGRGNLPVGHWQATIGKKGKTISRNAVNYVLFIPAH